MRINSNYSLCTVGGAKYLLPYAQGICDHKRGVKLNATGVVIWEAIVRGLSGDALLEHVAEYYEASEEEVAIIKEDIDAFLIQLTSMDIIIEDEIGVRVMNVPKHYIQIGPISLEIFCFDNVFPDEFKPFECPRPITVDYNINTVMGAPASHVFGEAIIRNSELNVYDSQEFFTLEFPTFSTISECRIYKTVDRSDLYYSGMDAFAVKTELFHAIRHIFLYTAARRGCFALHSSSILYDGKAWLFSGPSGTGKSTHTNLWKKLYDTPIINGDLNLMGIEDNQPVIYGMPWCGTSGICSTEKHKLGGVILLQQSPTNKCIELLSDARSLLTLNRLVSPMWTKGQQNRCVDFTNEVTKKILVCKLECNMEDDAAETMKNFIDTNA